MRILRTERRHKRLDKKRGTRGPNKELGRVYIFSPEVGGRGTPMSGITEKSNKTSLIWIKYRSDTKKEE